MVCFSRFPGILPPFQLLLDLCNILIPNLFLIFRSLLSPSALLLQEILFKDKAQINDVHQKDRLETKGNLLTCDGEGIISFSPVLVNTNKMMNQFPLRCVLVHIFRSKYLYITIDAPAPQLSLRITAERNQLAPFAAQSRLHLSFLLPWQQF